ncbi:DinB family protein [Spirosoma soli]|uniref:DinB family protein n=1 Tax=Spirosoma soli TaxID=1770529 RepID=A0ABW5LWK0_9BACT
MIKILVWTKIKDRRSLYVCIENTTPNTMPSFNSQTLLIEHIALVYDISTVVRKRFGALSAEELNQRLSPEKWSIAQCLEHLNTYGRYYLPLLEQAIVYGEVRHQSAQPTFRSSWLGNYFANTMRPKANGTIAMPMKAFKAHTPAHHLDASAVIDEFMVQQQQLLQLLERAQQVNIGALTVPISIARWIKLSVGDTFRFLIAHEQRHLLQAERVADWLSENRILGHKLSV